MLTFHSSSAESELLLPFLDDVATTESTSPG